MFKVEQCLVFSFFPRSKHFKEHSITMLSEYLIFFNTENVKCTLIYLLFGWHIEKIFVANAKHVFSLV